MASIPVPVRVPRRHPEEKKTAELGVVQLSELAEARPLELAARLVDQYRRRDAAFPPLADFAAAPGREFYCAPDLAAPAAGHFVPFATRARALPLDLAAAAQKAGLLPQLDRAWLAVGRELFLWNYRTGSVHRFDALAADITAVHVVPPKAAVFTDVVKHLLVISTTEHICLYAVSYGAEGPGGDLTVYDTGISVNISGLGTPRVCPDIASGRILFTADKRGASLFEARYTTKESWFSSRSSLVTHAGHAGRGLFGGAGDADETIVDVVADDSRGTLYTLSSRSTIRVFTYSPGDGDVRQTATYQLSQISVMLSAADSASRAANGTANGGGAAAEGDSARTASATPAPVPKKDRPLKLVALAAYSVEQSATFPLAAVTDAGVKILFRMSNPRWSAQFGSVVAREPPSDREFDAGASSARLIDRDFLIATVPQKGDASALFAAAVDATRILQQTDHRAAPPLPELAGWMVLDGTVRAVARASRPIGAPVGATPGGGASGSSALSGAHGGATGYGNTTAWGYAHDASEAIVLTSKAAYLVRARNFYERLEVGGGGDHATQLAHAYGHMELCCAALAVATRPSSAVLKQQRDAAAAVYFRMGGLPVFRKDIEATRSTYIHDPTTAIGASAQAADAHVAVRLSSLFDGLTAYVARLLQDVWDLRVVSYTSGKDGKPRDLRLNVDKARFEVIYSTLTGLAAFLDSNKSFSEGMSSRPQYSQHIYGGDISVLSQAEQRSLGAVSKLVQSSQQGIGFLLLILSETQAVDNGLDQLLSYFSKENYGRLLDMSFRSLVSEVKHSEVTRELVTSLVNFVINRGGNIDSLARVMQDRASSYCSASDILIYKALQFLHAANSANGSAERDARMRNLYESVALFKRAAKDLHVDTLKDIAEEYLKLEFYSGLAEIVLTFAAEVDKAGVAAAYLRDGKPERDPRAVVYEKKLGYYNILLDELHRVPVDTAAGKEAYRVMLESKDEVFHFYLYDWLLANDKSDRLGTVNTPFIRLYLQAGARRDVRIAELLWRYYQKRDDLLAAADVLLALGRGPLSVSMAQRIEFLSRAMNYCNTTFSMEQRQQVARLSTMVSSYLQIANVQSDILDHVLRDKQLEPALRAEAERVLNSQLLSISDLYNEFSGPLGYHDVSLAIFDVAEFRDPVEVQQTWDALFTKARTEDELEGAQHYLHISAIVQTLGRRFLHSAFVFPLDWLVPFTEKYAVANITDAPRGWVVEAFLNAGAPPDAVYSILIEMLVQKFSPFNDADAASQLAGEILYLLSQWIGHGDSWKIRQLLKAQDLRLLGELGGEDEAARFTGLVGA